MSIFTTMRAGASVLPPASRLPTVGDGGGDSFSSLVNGRMPAPEDNQPARLSIYSAISADALGVLSNGFASNSGDVTNDLPSGGGGEATGDPGGEVTNELPLAGSVAGWSSAEVAADDRTNGLPKVSPSDDKVESPIGKIVEGTVTNELPRVIV